MARRRRRGRDEALREQLMQLAEGRCEYCCAPQEICAYRFHLDHIRSPLRGGSDNPSMATFACGPCNFAKYNRDRCVDPDSGTAVGLFNSRRPRMVRPFRMGGRPSHDCGALCGRACDGSRAGHERRAAPWVSAVVGGVRTLAVGRRIDIALHIPRTTHHTAMARQHDRAHRHPRRVARRGVFLRQVHFAVRTALGVLVDRGAAVWAGGRVVIVPAHRRGPLAGSGATPSRGCS